MSDPLDLQEDTAFSAVLRWLNRPGAAVRNVLKGNVGGAVRQAADFVLDPWDAFIPGDVIPSISQAGDFTEASDLVGGMDPGWAKTGVDIVGGIATDPLTYTGLGLVKGVALAPAKAAAMGAKAVAPKIPGGVAALNAATKATKDAGMTLRSAIGAERVDPWVAKLIKQSEGTEGVSLSAQKAALEHALTGLNQQDQVIASRVIQNITKGDKGWRELLPEGVTNAPYEATDAVRAVSPSTSLNAADVVMANQAIPDVVEVTRDPTAKMLGAVGVTQPRRSGAKLADVTESVNMQQGGIVPELTKTGAADLPELADKFVPIDEIKAANRQKLAMLGIKGVQAERIAQALDKYTDVTAGSFRELADRGVFQKPIGRDLTREAIPYVQRVYNAADEGTADAAANIARKIGRPMAAKQRTLEDGKALADYLNANPKELLDEDFSKLAFSRGNQQAKMVKQGELARGVVDKFAKQADEKMYKASNEVENWTGMTSQADKYAAAGLTEAEALAYEAKYSSLFGAGGGQTKLSAAMNKAIEEIATVDPETARVLSATYHGLAPRGQFMEALAKINSVFKPYATAGAFIPRLSFSVRNVLTGGSAQVLANPSARPAFLNYVREIAPTMLRSIDDGIEKLTGTRIAANEFDDVNRALAQSNGRIADAVQMLPPGTMREALENGVITDGFANAELLSQQIARTGWSKTWRDMRDWPAAIAQGTEQRMRYGTFKALREKFPEKTPQEVAQIVEDTFFKYRPTSELNRAARDVIPFFQFTAKAVPQQARFLAGSGLVPAAGRNIAEKLYGGNRDAVVPPYMQGAPLLDIGKDEAGDRQFITSLGMPWEALGQLPNPSDDLMTFLKQTRQDIVGSSNPALKTGLSAVMGVDPYFGTPFASFDKAPYALQAAGVPEHGAIGRAYNVLAGSGAIQPISSPLSVISNVLDPRTSAGETALNVASGIKIKSVDEDRALQQLVEEKLKADPSIQRYEALYAYSPDPGQQELLDELKRVKQQIREKRKANQHQQ